MTVMTKTMLRKIIREEVTSLNSRAQRRNRNASLSENFLTDAIGSLGSGIVQKIKNEICSFILEQLGVPENHFMGRVICNTFENLEMDELETIMFGAESNDSSRCKEMAENLLEGLAETLGEKLREEILPDSNGVLFRVLEDTIINSIVDNNQLIESTAEVICKAMSDAMESVTG